jgi:uncharacterized protein Yka (UPF0111/DUF47 family)
MEAFLYNSRWQIEEVVKEIEALETQCDNCAWNIGRTLRLQEEWEAKQSEESKKY